MEYLLSPLKIIGSGIFQHFSPRAPVISKEYHVNIGISAGAKMVSCESRNLIFVTYNKEKKIGKPYKFQKRPKIPVRDR